jgi:hypothetical protein
MAITTLDGYIGAAKQKIVYDRLTAATSVAAQWHTLWNLPGQPGAGSFGTLWTTADASLKGRVCDDSLPGFPNIYSFGVGNTGYISGFDFSNTVAGKYMLYDRIWEAGQFIGIPLRDVSLVTDASKYEYRIPFKSDGTTRAWETVEMWVDISIQFSASATVIDLGYINESGVQKRTPATGSLSGFITGRTFQMPLAAGDKGVQRITDVSIGGATNAAGIFSIYLARTLYTGARVVSVGAGDVHSFEKLGMPKIDASAALALNYAADSTSTGVIDCIIEICNG